MNALFRLLRLAMLVPLSAVWLAAQAPARTAPKPVVTPAPEYPDALVDSGRDGTAVIEFTVEPDGSVTGPAVKSADHPAFGEAALAALPNWKFEPGTREGKASAMKVALPFQFAAPPDQRVNAIFRRKVFQDIAETPLATADYRGSVAALNTPPLRYPANLAGSGRTPAVEVEFVITPQGQAINPIVLTEVQPEFAAMAIMHVAALVFEPPTHQGHPVYVTARRTLNFAE